MYRKTAFQIFISGGKGQGKTTLTDNIADRFPRRVVFDITKEYVGKGYTLASSPLEVLKIMRASGKRGFKIAFVPPNGTDPAEQLSILCDWLCRAQQSYFDTPDLGDVPPIPKLLLMIDEMRWSYGHGNPYKGLDVICTMGRHYGIDCIGTTQRIAEVHPKFRGTSSVRYFFAQEEHVDVSTIAKMIGPKMIPTLKALKPHEYLRLFQGRVEQGKNSLKR